MRKTFAISMLCLIALLGIVSGAQPSLAAGKLHRPSRRPVVAAKPAPPPLVPTEPVPPLYEPQLLRLSELVGALTYLRDLCNAGDGNVWRAKMAMIIEAEATTPTRREKLAGAFNKGFRDYEITYRTCTPNADAIIARYLDEGGRLAHEIGNRYSGG